MPQRYPKREERFGFDSLVHSFGQRCQQMCSDPEADLSWSYPNLKPWPSHQPTSERGREGGGGRERADEVKVRRERRQEKFTLKLANEH